MITIDNLYELLQRSGRAALLLQQCQFILHLSEISISFAKIENFFDTIEFHVNEVMRRIFG